MITGDYWYWKEITSNTNGLAGIEVNKPPLVGIADTTCYGTAISSMEITSGHGSESTKWMVIL